MKKRTNRYSRKTYIISLLVILAAIGGIYAAGVYQIYHFNSEMVIPDTPGNEIVVFKQDHDGYIQTPSQQLVTLDMGSRHSFITPESLEALKEQGYDAKEQQTLIYTTDQSGHYHIYTRKVVMPVVLYARPDSSEIITFDNVELLISSRNEGNVLGMDFLERFVIEGNKETKTISLLREVPKNYDYVSDINGHDSTLGDLLGYSRRIYITLQVNDEAPQNYYFDTGRGIRSCQLVQPLKNANRATSKVYVDSVSGLMTQDFCRVLVGNRMRFARVTYSDSLHTDNYSINPFRVFNRSIVIDIPNRKLYYQKPTTGNNNAPNSVPL